MGFNQRYLWLLRSQSIANTYNHTNIYPQCTIKYFVTDLQHGACSRPVKCALLFQPLNVPYCVSYPPTLDGEDNEHCKTLSFSQTIHSLRQVIIRLTVCYHEHHTTVLF